MIRSRIRTLNANLYPRKIVLAPEWLVLGVNNICNLHCKMCDVGLKANDTNFAINLTGTKPINMPMELCERIFDQAAAHYPNVKVGYAFTEPLIYPHLIESLSYAQNLNLFTSITTNALNLRHKARQLVDSGLDEIYVSLDGPQDIHNYIRGHKNSFQRALEGIEILSAFPKAPRISVYCVITEWNIGHLYEFAETFTNLSIEEIGFMHTNFTTSVMADEHNRLLNGLYPATLSNTEELTFENFDLDDLLDEIHQLKKENYPFRIRFSPDLNSRQELEVFYHHPHLKIGKRCNDVFRNIMIKSDGSVIPAHGRCYNLTVGNIYEDELDEIWNSKIYGQFRHDLMSRGGLFPACSRCCSAF